MELKIEYVGIDTLKPYENNARSHGKDDVKAIVKSITDFGFNDPIGVWHDEIVEGHGRLMAAKELGMSEVPIIRLDELTDEQRRAYMLAHNKTAELSGWNFDILDAELADISEFDMSQYGFDITSIDGFTTDFELPDGDKPEIETMTFTLHREQKEAIEDAIKSVEPTETFGNTNNAGNCLYEVIREWAEQRI